MKLITTETRPGPAAALLLILILLTSCSWKNEPTPSRPATNTFSGLSAIIAQELIASGKGKLGSDDKIILTTFVNLNDLYQTSGFGRSITEALSTELFQNGYNILEIRKSPKIYLKNGEGELILSRDASILARQHNAGAILTGTYSLTPTTVIVNARILSVFSHDVLAAAALEIGRDTNINYLLTKNKEMVIGPISAYER